MTLSWTQKTFDPGPVLTLGPGLQISIALDVTRTERKWNAYVFGQRIDEAFATEAAAKSAALARARRLMLVAIDDITSLEAAIQAGGRP